MNFPLCNHQLRLGHSSRQYEVTSRDFIAAMSHFKPISLNHRVLGLIIVNPGSLSPKTVQTLLSNHDLCGARFHLSSEGFRFEGLGPDTMLSDFLRTQCPEVTRYYSPQTYLEHYGRFKMLHSSNMLASRHAS